MIFNGARFTAITEAVIERAPISITIIGDSRLQITGGIMAQNKLMSAPESFAHFKTITKCGENTDGLLQSFFQIMKSLYLKYDENYISANCTAKEYESADSRPKAKMMAKSIRPIPRVLADYAEKSEDVDSIRFATVNRAVQQGVAGNTAIYLGGKQQILGGKRYSLGRTMVMVSPLEDDPHYIFLRMDEIMHAAITIGNEDGTSKAFFDQASGAASMEVDELCMLAEVLDNDDSGMYIFTYFSKRRGIVFSGFITSLKDNRDIEIENLNTKLAIADAQSAQQRGEIQRLTDALRKENKDAIKPYAIELSQLNGRIRELENALETETAKNPELNALREFAFDTQSEYTTPETTTTLAELICGKKIIIVGGHITWRNRMKERHPSIMFLDGHNKALNHTVFDKADFILFDTSNMSHTTYEKAICYLRDRRLRFNYLGRSKNQELMEAEIVSILQEKI